jgi:hypothetical protein
MANVRGKAQCVAWFIETKSDIQVQRNFRTFNKDPPSRSSIRWWHKNVMETVCTSLIILVGLGRVKKTLSESRRRFNVHQQINQEGITDFVSVNQATHCAFSRTSAIFYCSNDSLANLMRSSATCQKKTFSVTVSWASRTSSVTYIQHVLEHV